MGANGRGTRVVHPAREEFHAAREEFRSEFRPARSDVRSTRRAVDDVYRPVHRVHPHLDAFTRIRVRALLRQHQRREQRDFANRVEEDEHSRVDVEAIVACASSRNAAPGKSARPATR